MESNLHLVMRTSYATFEVQFMVKGEEVRYVALANGEVVSSTTLDRTAAMLKWNDLVAKGYSPGKA